MEVQFKNLEKAELIIDCIYKGGTAKNISDEVLPRLLPKCGNSSGFRKVSRVDDPSKMAYVVLYTSMSELEWPDYLDEETGIFRYYGDNRKPGRAITDTKIRYRQFGVMVTTSYVDNQAYSEVVEDDHPILIVTATDIAEILRSSQINQYNIDQWFESVDRTKSRLEAYYSRIQELTSERRL